MSAQNRNLLPQVWKAWVLLTSVAITALGSWAIRPPTSAGGGVAPTPGVVGHRSELVAELGEATPLARPARALPRRGSRFDGLPSMPTKPMFDAPVTRTRRS